MTKTRILRLLLLSAVALPLCLPAGAQEAKKVNSSIQIKREGQGVMSNASNDLMSTRNANLATEENEKTSKIEITINQNNDATLSSKSLKEKVGSTKKSALLGISRLIDGEAKLSPKTHGISLKDENEDGTVYPPSSAKIEEWNITAIDDEGANYQASVPSVKVAKSGNDFYISGFLDLFEPSWIKGTLEGNTVTFPSYQIYGYYQDTYLFVFGGIDGNSIVSNVQFTYDEEAGTLTQVGSALVGNLYTTDGETIYLYKSLSNIKLTRRAATVGEKKIVDSWVPVAGPYLNNTTITEMIYSADKLKSVGLREGDKINSITFYCYPPTNESNDWNVPAGIGSASFQFYVGETTDALVTTTETMNSHIDLVNVVFSGNLPTGNQTMTINFSSPYTYSGKNLIIMGFVSSTGTATDVRWLCDEVTEGESFVYVQNAGYLALDELPVMTLNFTPFATRKIEIPNASELGNKTYTWSDGQVTHTSYLTDTATDPNQIIALLTEVYTNKDIPGNLKRGFTTTGADEANNDVNYGGVGTITRNGNNNYSYSNSYGWDIPGTLINGHQAAQASGNRGTFYYSYMDPEQYKPQKEGLTLLLVEMADDFNSQTFLNTTSTTPADKLRDYISNSIKSVRLLTEAKRMGEGLEAGTLFKIDCDKMNKFYLIAKGQLRWIYNSYFAEYTYRNQTYTLGETFSDAPCYIYNTDSYNRINKFVDDLSYPMFYNMFEEFSPSGFYEVGSPNDLYQEMVNMKSFDIKHDCQGVPVLNHQFMMYGEDSDAADCQDVRDLMFFIPDYRMMNWDTRDGENPHEYQKFMNYNQDHQPTMGLYVIRQNEITPTIAADDYYMLNLNWVTNLDSFLPSEDQEFELLQIVVNEDGVEEYVPVYYMNENGEYTDANGNVVDEANKVPIVLHLGAGAEKNYPRVYVARQSSSQQVTYAIRGRDTGHFLSLQISNRQSFIIPGTDPKELVSLIELSHYSRYNPDLEENCYSNRFKLSNNVGGVTRGNLSAAQGSQNVFTFTRKTSSTDVNPVTIATATVTATNTSDGTITIEMQNQATETEFPKAKTGNGYAGYHANPGNGTWTINFTYDNINGTDYVDFGDLVICDNFVVDVSNNEHPSQYIYEVKFNVVPDNLVENHNFDEAHGSAFRVPIYKTASRINNTYTAAEVSGDMDRSIEVEDLTFGERVQYSSKTEILRYDVYRWNSTEQKLYIVDEVYANDTEQDLPPDGIAGNQGEGYTVSMNDINGQYYYDGGTVNVSSQGLTFVDFVDYYPARVAESSGEASAYIYAPVVESFTTGKSSVGAQRTDYNTYGGPQQVAAVGVLDVKVQQPDVNSQSVGYMSTYNWTNDGKTYAYYKVPLTISKKDVPAGYGIYKIRAWREIDAQYLNEEHADVSDEIARRMDSSYPFEDITFDPNVQNPAAAMDAIDELGVTEKTLEGVTTVAKTYTTGTFGAQKVGDGAGEIAELPMKFYVRIYFTRNANLPVAQTSNAPRLKDATAADGKYYIVEKEIPFSITKNNIITAIDQLNARQVAGVKYYNVAGVESDRPFHGVNIVVTRYTDGSMTTTKVVK